MPRTYFGTIDEWLTAAGLGVLTRAKASGGHRGCPPAIKPLFTPLNETASAEVIRIAARELLAYFEADEPEFDGGFSRAFYFGCNPRRRRVTCVPMSVTCE